MIQNNQPSHLWFMSQGYRKHPRLDLWGHEGCAYLLNACGHKLAHDYGPCKRASSKQRGYIAPCMRWYKPHSCHILMGEIFYGEREVFKDGKGKPYPGQCHHLINEPLNYAPENLLCWLTRSEHRKADNRRRALEAIAPDHNLHVFSYERLRELENPRTMPDEDFQTELARIRDKYKKRDPKSVMDHDLNNHCEI